MKKKQAKTITKSSLKSHKQTHCIKDSANNSDYDFNQDLIDEHIGLSIVPVMMSLVTQDHNQSTYHRALRSIQNIQNALSRNNLSSNNSRVYDNKKSRIKNGENEFYRDTDPQLDVRQSKFNSHRFQQNYEQRLMKRQSKLRQIKKQIQNKQMKQCTFSPNTHTKSKKQKTPVRKLQQFLKNQAQYINKVQKKRQALKKKQQSLYKKQTSFKPKINRNFQGKSQNNQNKKPIYERLYELKQSKTLRSNIDVKQDKENINFSRSKQKTNFNKTSKSPCYITTGKNENNYNFLYQDAKRRQNLSKVLQKSRSRLNHSQISKSKNNEKYAAQKFIKQFQYIIQEMEINYSHHQTQNAPNDKSLEYFTQQQFNQILRKLGFLIYEQNEQSTLAFQQRNLALEAYQILQQYGVNYKNVCTFLLSLMGIFDANSLHLDSQLLNNLGESTLQITQRQGRKYQIYFDLLYRNKLASNVRLKKIVSKSKKSISVSPSSKYISPRHEQQRNDMALKYRSKMIQKANQRFLSNKIDIHIPSQQILTHEDLLVIDSLGRNLQRKRLKESKQAFLDEQCTFHPKVNKTANQITNHHSKGIEKSKQLYLQAKCKLQLQKLNQIDLNPQLTNRSGNQTSRNCQTSKKAKTTNKPIQFKEQIKSKKIGVQKYTTKQLNKKRIQPKDTDKAIARMAIGRAQREQINKFLQRGEIVYNKKSHQKSTSNIHHKSVMNHNHSSIQFNNGQGFENCRGVVTQRDIIQQNRLCSEDAMDEPFLVIDVNMGEQTQQIQFYSGDEKKVGLIVDQFCIDYDLDDQCKDQLLQMVQYEIQRYLNNVGIESTDIREQFENLPFY